MLQQFSRKTLVILTVIANIIYIVWRIFYTIPQGQGWISLFFAISLLVIEVIGMGEMFVHFYGMTNIQIPELPHIDDDLFPHVDVMIATYNEPIDLVQKTINGCLRMEYPDLSKVHIYICDDGSRPEMEAVCEKMGVGYIKRAEHKHAKAGNLNHAMQITTSPLLVTFDADMIPRHEFLMRTIPYFMKNEQAVKNGEEANYPPIGFIQTPQCFYNTDLFQFNLHSENRIPNEQDYFYRDVQTAKNATNSVIYGGSNTVISRQALNDVGGFYSNSITEDFATGMLIQSKGYRCYALDTALASGLAPDDLKSLIKQRERWGRGCIQTGRRLNLLFISGLTMGQKLSYLTSISYWYSSVKRFFYIMAPIVYAVFGIVVVECTLPQVLVLWLPMYVLTNATIKKFSNNIRNTRWTNIYETIMFQALMIPVILETLCISQNKFLVTRKDKKTSTDRGYHIKQAIPFTGYILLSIMGIFNMLRIIFISESLAGLVLIFWLVSNLYNLCMAIFFLLGRRQYRLSDRFLADIPYHLQQGSLDVKGTTIDISEGGFALFSDMPDYINPEEPFQISFSMDTGKNKYHATMKGKIAQVVAMDNGWKYAGYICDIDEENTDEWNGIVHDRLPSLPQTIVNSKGFYDDFEVNIRRRLKKQQFFSQTTVRVAIEAYYLVPTIGHLWIKDFNYRYLIVEYDSLTVPAERLTIPVEKGVILHCSKDATQIDSREIIYRVDNLEDVMASPVSRMLLANRIRLLHQQTRQGQMEAQDIDNYDDEINLLDLV